MDINSSNLNQITYFNYDQIYYKYLNIIYIFIYIINLQTYKYTI